jgi:pyrroline-5-carboxylate reductase
MAGVTLTTISKHLGAYTRLVRTMPNTPALIGAGITGYYPYPGGVSDSDIVATETILKAVGSTVRVGYQEQLDVVTAVSGSGPAYVFHFIEALRDAGLELGLPAETANKLAIETMLGAAKLAAQSPDDVAVLRQRVTSKGGTTEAALASMTRDHVKESIIRAVKAASDRSRELGDELGKG